MISILSSFHYFHQKYTFEVIYGDRLPTPVFLGFPCGSAAKESAYSAGDLGSIPGLGRFPGEGKGYLLQYSGLENTMDCIVHGVANSRTRLDNFHFHKICTLQSKASTLQEAKLSELQFLFPLLDPSIDTIFCNSNFNTS